jgi:O-antigen ligase
MNADRYRSLLTILAIAVFFTNLSNYLFQAGLLSMQPYVWIVGYGLLLAPLAIPAMLTAGLQIPPLAVWAYGFGLVSLLWFLGSTGSSIALEELETRLLSLVFLLMMLFAFSTAGAQRLARRAVAVAALFGVAINLFELFNPESFSSVLGRSAGLYVNPNQSGAALVLAMILGLDAIRPHWRPAFMLIVGLGVTTTFSRSAMLTWAIAFVLLCAFDLFRHRRLRGLVGAGLAGMAVVAFVVSPAWAAVQGRLEDEQVLNEDVLGRVSSFSLGQFDDDSATERADVATLAWEQFSGRPIFGSGTGASIEPPFDVGPHNIYLALMVEHGFLGLLVFPALVAACTWGAAPPDRMLAATFAAALLALGLFSHNLLSERYALIAYALMASIVATGRRRHLPAGGHA